MKITIIIFKAIILKKINYKISIDGNNICKNWLLEYSKIKKLEKLRSKKGIWKSVPRKVKRVLFQHPGKINV